MDDGGSERHCSGLLQPARQLTARRASPSYMRWPAQPKDRASARAPPAGLELPDGHLSLTGRRPVWCSGRCRNIAALTRRGAREPAVQVRMFDVPKAAKPRPARTPTREEKDESAISRIARSSRLSRDLLVRLQNRRQRGELASEVWDDITAMLDQFVPGYSPRLVWPAPRPPAASRPAAASTLSELTQALRRLSAGFESGRIYDRDFATLGPALERLGNAWVRRTSL